MLNYNPTAKSDLRITARKSNGDVLMDVTVIGDVVNGFTTKTNIPAYDKTWMCMVKLLQTLCSIARETVLPEEFKEEMVNVSVEEDGHKEELLVKPRRLVYELSECCPFNGTNLIVRLKRH